MTRGNTVRWIRDEGLASIRSVEFADLPPKHSVSDSSTDDNIISAFVNRISNDITGIQDLIGDLFSEDVSDGHHGLHRDQFNQRHIIVAVSSSGKIFGLDTNDGKVCVIQSIGTNTFNILFADSVAAASPIWIFAAQPIAVILTSQCNSRCSTHGTTGQG